MQDDAFAAYFERHHAALSRLAYLMTGDPAVADELAADALAGVRRDWDRIAPNGDPAGHGRRLVLRATRDRSPRGDRNGVLGALGRLPWRLRACVVLRHLLGLPDADIAAVLRIPVPLARWRTTRGARRLGALIEGAPAGPPGLIDGAEAVR